MLILILVHEQIILQLPFNSPIITRMNIALMWLPDVIVSFIRINWVNSVSILVLHYDEMTFFRLLPKKSSSNDEIKLTDALSS